MKIAYIEWVDSCNTRGWNKPEDASLCYQKSVGLVAREDDKMIVLSTSVGDNGNYTEMLAIPKVAITKTEIGEFPNADHPEKTGGSEQEQKGPSAGTP